MDHQWQAQYWGRFPASFLGRGGPYYGVHQRAKLPTVGPAASISKYGSQQVVACGVSGYLYSYRTGSPHKFYADAAFSLGVGHALGLKATFTSLSQVKTALNFVNSISFPLPICVGKPAKH